MQNLMLIPLLVRNFGKESDISTCGFVLATHRNLLSNNDIAACTLYIHIAIIVPAVMIHIETKYAENPKIAQGKCIHCSITCIRGIARHLVSTD